jgi:riboflavin synthase
MFTGLVETLGTVRATEVVAVGTYLKIAAALAAELKLGESIAVNGVCLTVVECDATTFGLQVGPETLDRTNLGGLAAGERVNLERSLRLSDRLGGHLVQGHVDGIGRIAERRRDGDWEFVTITCPATLTAQMIPKGSIAVDGISLTLTQVAATHFAVALIPHTLAITTLGFKSVGADVNLETDVIGKYVMKMVEGMSLK